MGTKLLIILVKDAAGNKILENSITVIKEIESKILYIFPFQHINF